ncbi:NmrA/HSCARG family protein [Nannocystis pusilla]|uniref:NmrA/HSCARG family protein n=1 Tax=Nannocystis pusilla TaxID=889268 RepID=UPI003BF40A14
MTDNNKFIVVIGATGQQGGATAKHLIEDGWRVRALVRDLHGPKAQALAEAGLELVYGDLNDRASLDAALRGAHGVFSVQPSAGQPQYGVTPEDEVRQGKSVADAAKAAGVAHLVYTSVDGADDAGDVPHLASKWEIEAHIRAIGQRSTILRPASFMENFVTEGLGFSRGKVAYFGRPNDPVPLIAADDIGKFAALVFADPQTHAGTVLPLVGDVRTGEEVAAALGTAAGRTIAYERCPPEVVQHNPALRRVMAFIERYRTRADIPALRRLHPGLLDFAGWLATSGKPKLASLSRA